MAAPVYQAAATASTAGAASLTINKPTGVVDGDLMVAHVTIRTVETITAPAGWTQIYTVTNGGGTFVRTAAFWRIASGEGASYQFTWPTSQKAVGAIARITGSHASSPIDVAGTPATNTLTADSISTTATECLLLYLSAMADNSTFTAPTGMTERWDQATTNFNDVAHTMASESLSVSGATGTRTGTYGSTADGSSTLVAVAPPAAGGTNAPAENVSLTATAHDAQPGVAPAATESTAAAAAHDPTTHVAPVTTDAAATATAHDATVTTTGATNAAAEAADATATAHDATLSVASSPTEATGAATADDPSAAVAVVAEAVAIVAAAHDATVTTPAGGVPGRGSITAARATGTIAATRASGSITVVRAGAGTVAVT